VQSNKWLKMPKKAINFDIFVLSNYCPVTNTNYLLFLISWLSIPIAPKLSKYPVLVSKFSWVILFRVCHRLEVFVLGGWQVVFRHKKNGCPGGCRFDVCRKG